MEITLQKSLCPLISVVCSVASVVSGVVDYLNIFFFFLACRNYESSLCCEFLIIWFGSSGVF